MATQIEKSFKVRETPAQTWKFLSDPRRVSACVPGAYITTQVDSNTYAGGISVRFGSNLTDYRGEVMIVRMDEKKLEVEIIGTGQDAKGRAGASMKMRNKLRALPDGGTEISSYSELSVSGVFADLGSPLIHEAANIVFAEFSKNFRTCLALPEDSEPTEAAPISAASLAWQTVLGVFTHRS